MTTRGEINSNFYQIVYVDANGAPTQVKPEYITAVGNAVHADFADVANSVAVGNVVGIGNIATINLNNSSSNVLFGNGVWASPSLGTVANYANYAGNLVVVGNETNVYVKTSNVNIESHTQSGNTYTHQYQNNQYWGVYPEDDDTGAHPAWAWIEASLPTVNTPTFFIETKPGDTGIEQRWTFDSRGNLTLPGNTFSVNYANGTQVPLGGTGGDANYANYAGNVTISSQPNITSTGTLVNVTTSGQITSTGTGNSSDGGGQLFLNGSGNNRIDFNTNGVNGPTTTTRSAGTKVVLYPALNSTQTDYAIGINAATLWSSVPSYDPSFSFKWYGNTTEVASLNGTGTLSLIGNISSGNANLGNLAVANFFSGDGGLLSNITATTSNAISNGTSNVIIPVANGNVNTSVGGVANVFVVTTTGANVNGNLYVTNNITGNSLQLNTSTGVTTANVGAMFWDATEQTVTLGMNNGVQQQIGLENYILVKANSAITNGQVVMFVGVAGERILAAPANMSSAGFKPTYIIGMATQDIANAGTGYITTFGTVHDINTNAYNAGDILYVDPASTTGGFTATEPTAPNYHITIGAVTKKSGTGHIQVRVTIHDKVADLSDANITTPTAGQALIYTSSNTWINGNSNYANTAGTVVTGAQPNITSTGTLVSLTVTGNISSGNANLGNLTTSNFFSGNGSLLTSLTGGNVTGQVGNALVAGTVYTNAQPNITSTGTLVSLTVSGTGNIGNLVLNKYNELLPASANTSTSISPDLSTGSIFRYTANASFTFNGFTNAVSGSSAVVVITQGGSGSYTLTSTMKFAGGSKTLSTAVGAIDIISVFYDGTNYYATLSKGYA